MGLHHIQRKYLAAGNITCPATPAAMKNVATINISTLFYGHGMPEKISFQLIGASADLIKLTKESNSTTPLPVAGQATGY